MCEVCFGGAANILGMLCVSLSENRVRRRIFGPKREEVTGDWRRLHNEEPHKLYASQNIITVIKS
jgi:hypothetical protein